MYKKVLLNFITEKVLDKKIFYYTVMENKLQYAIKYEDIREKFQDYLYATLKTLFILIFFGAIYMYNLNLTL